MVGVVVVALINAHTPAAGERVAAAVVAGRVLRGPLVAQAAPIREVAVAVAVLQQPPLPQQVQRAGLEL